MIKGGCIYMMTNNKNTTVYTGVTSDLKIRVYQHKNNLYPESFTARYKLSKLVYFEAFHSIEEAIARENKLKETLEKRKKN